MNDADLKYALDNLPRMLNNLAARLQSSARMLEVPWKGVGASHSHAIGVVMSNLRYKANDLMKIAAALEKRT